MQALSRRQEEAAVGIGGVSNGKDFFTQVESSFGEMGLINLSQIGLPFVQCEGILKNAALPLQKQISDAKEGNHVCLLFLKFVFAHTIW